MPSREQRRHRTLIEYTMAAARVACSGFEVPNCKATSGPIAIVESSALAAENGDGDDDGSDESLSYIGCHENSCRQCRKTDSTERSSRCRIGSSIEPFGSGCSARK